jgi:hypothetical protein
MQPIVGGRARAIRDITRFRTRIVGGGSFGRIVSIDEGDMVATYTVEFALPRLRGATVTVSGLIASDIDEVQASAAPSATG